MNKPKSRNENIVVQEMDNEILIYDLKENKAFCLNETSSMIYQFCDGKRDVADISLALRKRLNQPISDDVIWLALNDFKRDNLLEESEQFEIDFNGLSRRQVIRKVGLASMIMLPVIASVVAPSAAAAQSGAIAFLGACPSGSGCATGLTCVTCINSPCPSPMTCCMGTTNGYSPGTVALEPSMCGVGNCNAYHPRCCSGSATFVAHPTCTFGDGGCICN